MKLGNKWYKFKQNFKFKSTIWMSILEWNILQNFGLFHINCTPFLEDINISFMVWYIKSLEFHWLFFYFTWKFRLGRHFHWWKYGFFDACVDFFFFFFFMEIWKKFCWKKKKKKKPKKDCLVVLHLFWSMCRQADFCLIRVDHVDAR